MKYLILATDTNKFRTKTSWVAKAAELFDGEKMLSFNRRQEAEDLIHTVGFKNCSSYGISKSHELYKHCE